MERRSKLLDDAQVPRERILRKGEVLPGAEVVSDDVEPCHEVPSEETQEREADDPNANESAPEVIAEGPRIFQPKNEGVSCQHGSVQAQQGHPYERGVHCDMKIAVPGRHGTDNEPVDVRDFVDEIGDADPAV